jgi:hypothetical protein
MLFVLAGSAVVKGTCKVVVNVPLVLIFLEGDTCKHVPPFHQTLWFDENRSASMFWWENPYVPYTPRTKYFPTADFCCVVPCADRDVHNLSVALLFIGFSALPAAVPCDSSTSVSKCDGNAIETVKWMDRMPTLVTEGVNRCPYIGGRAHVFV